MQVAAICGIFSISLFLVLDLIKFELIKHKKEKLWNQYKVFVPKVVTLLGLIFGLFLTQYFNSDLNEVMTSLGIGAGSGLLSTGIDNLLGGGSSRTFFGDPTQQQ
jgi:protein-S-isoprenylcysteine O-methyltransferase Ste14